MLYLHLLCSLLCNACMYKVHTNDWNRGYAADMLGRTMRQTDYLGLFKGGRLYALLPNTTKDNVGGIIERFRALGYECRIDEEAVLGPWQGTNIFF